MADSGTPLIPIFPAPPRPPPQGWTPDYGNQLNRWLQNVTDTFAAFTYGKFSGILLAPTFPTSGYGLRAGEVFANAGILTVVRPDDIWVGGLTATCQVGTITVSV
jgi:hypothetical protein